MKKDILVYTTNEIKDELNIDNSLVELPINTIFLEKRKEYQDYIKSVIEWGDKQGLKFICMHNNLIMGDILVYEKETYWN